MSAVMAAVMSAVMSATAISTMVSVSSVGNESAAESATESTTIADRIAVAMDHLPATTIEMGVGIRASIRHLPMRLAIAPVRIANVNMNIASAEVDSRTAAKAMPGLRRLGIEANHHQRC